MAKRKAFPSFKRRKVFNKTSGRCGYCGVKLALDNFQVDHIYPLAKGGSNLEMNLVAACEYCNKAKSSLTVYQFKQKIEDRAETMRENSPSFRLAECFGLIWVSNEPIVFYFEKLQQ